MNNFLLKIFLLSSCFFSVCLYAQDKNRQKIDQLFKLTEKYSWENRIKALKYAQQALTIAEKINDPEKKSYSYVYIAQVLSFLGVTDSSLDYLSKASDERYTSGDKVLQAFIKQEKSANFGRLGLNDQVLKENEQIILLLDQINTPKAARIRLRAYGNIAAHYMNIGEYKLALHYTNLAENSSKDSLLQKTEHIKGAISNLQVNKGYLYLYGYKNQDSAFYYFKKALATVIDEKEESKSSAFKAMGEYYSLRQNQEKSLHYYLLAVKDIENRKLNILNYKAELFKKISDLYAKLGHTKQSESFLELYNRENQITVNSNPENIRKAVDVILSETNKTRDDEYTGIVTIFLTLIIMVIIISIGHHQSRNKKIKKVLEQTESRLAMKRRLIAANEAEKLLLQGKIHNTSGELLSLVKSRDLSFYHRFNEIYPDFQRKLLLINRDISSSEFILLAYVYLDIETKDIADLTYKSIRTVQNRKYNLRKKLGLKSNQDFHIWLKELMTDL
ncbi:hypothetical protein SAMN05444371_2947 [Epilithonimonas mollis]|uniref:HTH luxR-type domain-containing protein n=1 Tax=Epilithonimonas mollis TaxID=216903 RepID=A0A1M6TUA7_9FLAO|nr:hypothetical protein SAMN05444371_2947 [Epilithonimonas mollis]